MHMIKSKMRFWVGVMAVVFAMPVHASEVQKKDPFYQLGRVKIKQKRVSQAEVDHALIASLGREFSSRSASVNGLEQMTPGQPGPGGGGLAIADIALRVWSIIQDNRAVLNVSRQNSKALPVLAKSDWRALTGWKPEHGIELSMTVENLYGIDVIDLSYVVSVIYGGSVRGAGQYIAAARVIPKKINVLWGFNMDVNVAEVAIQNIGTEKNPQGAVTLDVGVTYGSILSQTSFTNSYRLQGNGVIADLTNGKAYFSR
jgi:hypothetical protein